jgi:aspartate oxidase
MVGFDIRSVLSRRIGSLDGVRVLRNMALVDVSLKDGAIAGAIVYNHHAGRWLFVNVPTVVLATGGLGGLFEMSTNHPDNLGVAYSIALAAGAVLTDLEFVSFEPFVLQSPVELRGTSLPTTAVTEGCRILDNRGGSLFEGDGLPTKDEICRHMIRLAEEGDGSGVRNFIYDSSELPAAELEHYPKIKHAMTIAAGRPLCVMPAQHFLDGGIRVDEFGTSTVAGLYAVGEAAGGAHGAHRLAGCGGSEVVALGPVVGRAAAQFAMSSDRSPAEAFVPVWELLPDWRRSPLVDDTRAAVTSALSYGCGPMRDAGRLASAGLQVAEQMERLKAGGLEKSFAGRSVRLAAAMITSSALRKESRGDHFRCDHPECDDSWCGNLDVIQDSPLAEVRHRYRAAQGPRPTAVQAHVNDPAGSVNP